MIPKWHLTVVVRGLVDLSYVSKSADRLVAIDGLFGLPALSYLGLWYGEELDLNEMRGGQQNGDADGGRNNAAAFSCVFMPEMDTVNLYGSSLQLANVLLRNAACMPNMREVQLPCGVRMPELGKTEGAGYPRSRSVDRGGYAGCSQYSFSTQPHIWGINAF